ncbi:hypothetical protein HYS95_00090 [Candidatus Daviesbacteria bacterium]|nr:hypothetical protein [Candidatus Daviesbacteria bacterium]
MKKINKDKLSSQEFFSLEEISSLLEEEGENIGQYIRAGSLKIGKDLKVHRDDFIALIDHIISKSQNKNHRINIRGSLIILWLATIASFVATINTSNNQKEFSYYLGLLFLSNIAIGIVTFVFIFLPNKLKNFSQFKFIPYIPLISFLYFLFYLTIMTINGHGLITNIVNGYQESDLQKRSGASVENIWKTEIIAKINTERKKEDLTPLFENQLLDKSSETRAQDVLNTNSWEIKPKNGKDFSYFIKEAGYNSEYSGESLARNYYDTSSVVSSLMTDKTNKDNILGKNFKDIGVTVKEGFLSDKKTKIVVIHFGSPITPTATIKPSQKTVYTDPDPFIDCESSYPNCKGTSIRVRSSQCSKTTCCQVGTTWSIYPSNEKCDDAQKNFQSQQAPVQNTTQNISQPSSNKVPVFISYNGYTVYCPSQNVGAVQSIASTMESKKNQWSSDYNKCTDNLYKTDSCYVSCSNTNKNDLDICYAAYGYSGDNSSACTKEAWDNYSKCISGCPSASKSCDYVYWEQKNLSSQINNLCK